MKMVIDYNPFIIETSIIINGKEIAQDNVLFSINKYTLQCWLSPNGSWAGLPQIIGKISRGEKIELVFRGRTSDFDDFKETFSNNIVNQPVIELRNEVAYEKNVSIEMFNNCLNELTKYFNIDYKSKSLNKNFLEFVKVINNDNIQDSIDYLADNSYIYIFMIENFNDERCIDLIVQAIQGNNFYHSLENTVFVIKNSEKLSIEDGQAVLQSKGIKNAFIIPYNAKLSVDFNLKNVCEAFKSKADAKLNYLYQKYIEPKVILKDAKEVLEMIEKTKGEMQHVDGMEKEYYDTCREINTLQSQTLNENDTSLLFKLVKKNQRLLERINYLKNKKNQNQISEIAYKINKIFGIKDGI
jgi:hypothetical protein